jgi:protein-disulfide isomerase
VLLATLILLGSAASARAQAPRDTAADSATVKAELARVRADLDIVKGQLTQVLRLLNQRAAPGDAAASAPARASIADAPTLGRADAPVTIVEFSDYQCPFCQRFFSTTLAALKTQYIDAGKLRYVFRDSPLDQLHPFARKAAEAAHCAGEQGKYWEMHDMLFQNSRALAPTHLAELARAIVVDTGKFNECFSSGRHAARVERDVAAAATAGVRGTPGFVIGATRADGVVEGTPIRGAQPLDVFQRIIDKLLAEAATRPASRPSIQR